MWLVSEQYFCTWYQRVVSITRERRLLAVHDFGLQGRVQFGAVQRHRRRTEIPEDGHVHLAGRNADLEPVQIGRRAMGLVLVVISRKPMSQTLSITCRPRLFDFRAHQRADAAIHGGPGVCRLPEGKSHIVDRRRRDQFRQDVVADAHHLHRAGAQIGQHVRRRCPADCQGNAQRHLALRRRLDVLGHRVERAPSSDDRSADRPRTE